MSLPNCTAIRVKYNSSHVYCDSYRVVANEDSVISYESCSGYSNTITIQQNQIEELCCNSQPVLVSGDCDIELIGKCTDTDLELVGGKYFELDPDFDLRETKQVTELTDADTLKFDYVLGFDLPVSDNNINLIKTFINPNVIDNNYKEIEVEVIVGSHIIKDSTLYVVQCDYSRISVKLRFNIDHWARHSKSLKLNQLNYNTVVVNREHLVDVIENQYPYDSNIPLGDPTSLGIWYPYVNYGYLVQDPTDPNSSVRSNTFICPLEYWRPWYYVTGILARGFCALGWQFKSPFFESDLGRKIITYILDKNFGVDKKEDIKLKASAGNFLYLQTSFSGGRGIVKFPSVTVDPLGSLDPIGIIRIGGEFNLKGLVKFKNLSSQKADFNVQIIKLAQHIQLGGPNYGGTILKEEDFLNTESAAEVEFKFDLKGVTSSVAERLCITINRKHSQGGSQTSVPGVSIYAESFIEIEGIRAYFREGQEYSLKDMIDNSYNFLDFLKGLAGLVNLKIKTNFSTHTVELYTPYDADFWGDSLEGFYIEESINNITHLIDITSMNVVTPEIVSNRYRTLGFKKSTDKYIESLNLKTDLYSVKVDLGEKFTINESKEILNPFFEPTYQIIGTVANSFTVHVMRIGAAGGQDFNIAPRIAIARGNVIQDFDDIVSPKLRYTKLSDPNSKLIPTAAQFSPIKLGVQVNDENSITDIIESNLIYDISKEIYNGAINKTLYHLCYKRWFLEELNNVRLNYLTMLSMKDYLNHDFRKYYSFYHLGRLVVCRTSKVYDFHYCSNLQTPVEYIPQRQLSNLCNLLPDNNGEGEFENPICINYPDILVDTVMGCYNMIISGVNNSPIANVIFEYRLASSNTWIQIPNISQLSAQLCDIYEDFYVRATVSYGAVDGFTCSDVVTPERLFQPCIEANLVLECLNILYTLPGTKHSINALKTRIKLPDDNIIVNIISSTVSVDSAPPVSYNQTQINSALWGDVLYDGSVFDVIIVITLNDCPQEYTLTSSCVIAQGSPPPPTIDCEDIILNLECVTDENTGCVTFSKSGIVPYEYDEYIKYRTSSDGLDWSPWLEWDGEPICALYVEGRWFVHFCDGLCPMKCSNIASCFIPTANLSISCDNAVLTVTANIDISACQLNWTGPNAWTGTGNNITIPMVDGTYTVEVICSGQLLATKSYYFDAPYAGGGSVDPINWND